MSSNKNSYVDSILPNSFSNNNYNKDGYSYSFNIKFSDTNKVSNVLFYRYNNNGYSYSYTYALPYSLNSLYEPTVKPTHVNSNILTPKPAVKPPTPNYIISPSISPIIANNKCICENACSQCIEPYKYGLGFVSSFLGLLLLFIFFRKLNYKNIIKKYIPNNHRKSNKRKIIRSAFKNQLMQPLEDLHLENVDLANVDLENFGVINYNSEFSSESSINSIL